MIRKNTVSSNGMNSNDVLLPETGLLDSQLLLKVANQEMPFGKYAGKSLIDLPEPYLVWYSSQGFPTSPLGELLELTYEIKVNGLESLVYPLQKRKNIKEYI